MAVQSRPHGGDQVGAQMRSVTWVMTFVVGSWVSEPAMKPDEARRYQGSQTRQSFWLLLEEHDLLPSAWPDRLDEAPASPQLAGQRGWYLRECGRNQHRVVRRAQEVPLGAVASYDQDVANALGMEVVAGPGGDIGPPLDAEDGGRQPGQQCGLIAVTGSYLQHGLVASEAEASDHDRRQGRLGGDLAVADGQRPIGVRLRRVPGGNERRTRGGRDRCQDALIGDTCLPSRADQIGGRARLLTARHGTRISRSPYDLAASFRQDRAEESGRLTFLASSVRLPVPLLAQ